MPKPSILPNPPVMQGPLRPNPQQPMGAYDPLKLIVNDIGGAFFPPMRTQDSDRVTRTVDLLAAGGVGGVISKLLARYGKLGGIHRTGPTRPMPVEPQPTPDDILRRMVEETQNGPVTPYGVVAEPPVRRIYDVPDNPAARQLEAERKAIERHSRKSTKKAKRGKR